jgi:hypothetical protein
MKTCGYDNLGNYLNGSLIRKIMDAFGRVLSVIRDEKGNEHRLISKCKCQEFPKNEPIHKLDKEESNVLFSGNLYQAEPMYLKNNRHIAIVKIKEPHGTKKRIVEIPISHLFYVDKKNNI